MALDYAERERFWGALGQQLSTVHPYTLAAPGAWPGGPARRRPDADDTAGAISLFITGAGSPAARERPSPGSTGCRSSDSDGGIPTFCRGWGKLPFDRKKSGPDGP